jgi:hypothetical protein
MELFAIIVLIALLIIGQHLVNWFWRLLITNDDHLILIYPVLAIIGFSAWGGTILYEWIIEYNNCCCGL